MDAQRFDDPRRSQPCETLPATVYPTHIRRQDRRLASVAVRPQLAGSFVGASNDIAATHELTHHGGREEKIDELRKIEEAKFRPVASFLTDLQNTQKNGVSLMDRSSVLFSTNMGSANAHSNDNLPVRLAGGGFKHGKHLAFDRKNNYPLSTLYVSLLQRRGIDTDKFSSSTTTNRRVGDPDQSHGRPRSSRPTC